MNRSQFVFPRWGLAASVVLGLASQSVAAIPVLVAGDTVAGDQVTVELDSSIDQPLSYDPLPSGVTIATAYFNWHVFCTETAASSGQMRLNPRYQLPAGQGPDVWKFADIAVQDFSYNVTSAGLILEINQQSPTPRARCLSALPGSSLEPWYVNRGLFDEGFGDYIGANNSGLNTPPPQTPPNGPHQNVKVTAQQFPGLVAGREVVVVRIENTFDVANPAQVSYTLVEGYNASALSPAPTGANPDANMARWCLLRPDWVNGTTPPAALCADPTILFPGVSQNTTSFVRQGFGFPVTFAGPYYVLVSRAINGSPTSGSPKQAFAAIRTDGGMPGVAAEMQDWYPEDSVWYTY